MKVKFVDLPRQNKVLTRSLMTAIGEVIKEADFIEGKRLKDFEEAFARFCNKKYAIGVNSGTDALKFALLAYGIGPGDEVITVPNTYFSTAMVITNIGASVVFVDVNISSYTIDINKIESAITKKTKAIIPVHLYGQPAGMDPILKIAKKHNLVVIEDACQAHGASYGGKIVPVGETGAFSFYPGKNLGCFGDGGMLVTDNENVREKVLYLHNDGSKEKFIHQTIGEKSRLDTLQAAILSVKLPFLTEWNNKRRQHARLYNNLLKDVGDISLPKEDINVSHIYHLYVIETGLRDKLQQFLSERGIETGIHYPIPVHLQKPYINQGFGKGDFPITEEKAKSILSLPMFPELREDEIIYICEVIKSFFDSQIGNIHK